MPLKTVAQWLTAIQAGHSPWERPGYRFYRPGFPPGYVPVLAAADMARKKTSPRTDLELSQAAQRGKDQSGAKRFGSPGGTIESMARDAKRKKDKFKAVGPKRRKA